MVILIFNLKGGVGKSSTALNLGAALVASGKRVLLIDNDVQGNLTAALGYTPAELKNTLAKLLLAAIDTPRRFGTVPSPRYYAYGERYGFNLCK